MNLNLKIVTNHWGWSWRGIKTWLRFGWGLSTWGVEISGSSPRRYQRRAKVGLLTFNLGTFSKEGT